MKTMGFEMAKQNTPEQMLKTALMITLAMGGKDLRKKEMD